MTKIIFVTVFTLTVIASVLFFREGVITKAQKTPLAQTSYISLFMEKAEPDIVTIRVNDRVQFNSKDGNKHEISSGYGDSQGHEHEHDLRGVESGTFGPDEGYNIEFRKPGVYHFHDHLNPKIAATVVVY